MAQLCGLGQPVGSYLRYTGRDANVLAKAAHDPKRKPTLDLSEARLSAEVTTDAVMVSIPRAPPNPNSEIRIVRSRQPNPLAFIMFDWVLSADLFLPWREQEPIGDKDGERRRKDVGVLHRQFKP